MISLESNRRAGAARKNDSRGRASITRTKNISRLFRRQRVLMLYYFHRHLVETTMDLMKNIDRKISSLYKGESTEKLMTISAMIKTLLGLCVLAGFLAIIVKSSGFERYILIGLFAAFSLMLLASFRGAARQTSVVLTIVVSLALRSVRPRLGPLRRVLRLAVDLRRRDWNGRSSHHAVPSRHSRRARGWRRRAD
jgi:hypothetical protein